MAGYEQRIAALNEKNPFLSKTEAAYTLLLEDILEGRLKGGEKVSQEELSSLFHISRTPIREALNRLVKEGYLVKNGASGYSVYQLELADYISLNEFRSMLEDFGSRLAVKHITDREMDQLRENIRLTEEAVRQKDVKAFAQLDEAFHMILIQSSKNPHLMDTYRHYQTRFHLFRILTVSEEILNIALKWHRKIYQSVLDGDVEAAEENTRMHRETTINSALTVSRSRHGW